MQFFGTIRPAIISESTLLRDPPKIPTHKKLYLDQTISLTAHITFLLRTSYGRTNSLCDYGLAILFLTNDESFPVEKYTEIYL
mmetsp:Transcript_7458/g.16040  ORF Transcript_7458/g.16040 Transcript_7458/m.16040 type:complete len:83 (-) Transcript_7458:1158-1406(-)